MTPIQSATAKTDFSFLDDGPFRKAYSEGGNGGKMRFFVEGIRCAKCLRKIESLSETTPGLKDIRVEMGKNIVHVEFEPNVINPSQIATKIAGFGFQVRPLAPGSNAETQLKLEDRRSLIRLAVAGACAGNIMGFALAIYFGGGDEWIPLFSWLSFALYLPVVTYVAWPFYVGAAESLKQRKISIDLPMAVASLAGFIFSTVQLVQGGTEFYFDSLSGLLFLILLARYVQKRMQRHYLEVSSPAEDLTRVRLGTAARWKWALTRDLKPGDRFLLEAGETLPAEAELISPRAHVSQAWLTGESRPRVFLSGSSVPAGARLIGSEAAFVFLKPLEETDFGRTLIEVQRFAMTKNRAISIADRWTQWLLGGVFALAFAFLFLYWPVDPTEAIHRALALIVIACPCAMAFGTPLAMAFSLKKARAAGLLIADANVFESVTSVKNIFFDKTGTLTDLDLSLTSDTRPIWPVYQKVVLALENQSLHPIAFAFRKAFPDLGKLPPVGNYKEIPGSGVSGYIFGKHYSLQKDPAGSGDELACVLFEDDRLVYRFTFEANIKADVDQVLNGLRKSGYKIQLLSGDNSEATRRAAKKLGFADDEIHGGLTPEQKADFVARTPDSMMIGDGVNDAAALMRAKVGVAVAGAVGAALKSARVYLKADKLDSVAGLFKISTDAFHLIRQNLLISLIYNVTAGVAALTGYIDPLAAAVLMPVSSGIILTNAWRWGRK